MLNLLLVEIVDDCLVIVLGLIVWVWLNYVEDILVIEGENVSDIVMNLFCK